MKFGKYWETQVSQMPYVLRSTCINYKTYKKITKLCDNSLYITDRLSRDATVVSDMFIKFYKNRKIDDNELMKYSRLNCICMRKICKRFDKHHTSTKMTEWLSLVRSNHVFAFMEGRYLTLATLRKHDESSIECPICFDCFQKIVVMNCGHIICTDCTLRMIRAKNLYGTLYNVIAHATYRRVTKCPICRDSRAFHRWTLL